MTCGVDHALWERFVGGLKLLCSILRLKEDPALFKVAILGVRSADCDHQHA